jgi:hypothetical protein
MHVWLPGAMLSHDWSNRCYARHIFRRPKLCQLARLGYMMPRGLVGEQTCVGDGAQSKVLLFGTMVEKELCPRGKKKYMII